MTLKRFEIGNSIVLVLVLIVLLTFTTMFNSHEIALGVISSCGTKLKVSIMGLPNQRGNASAIVIGQLGGSSYHFANSTILIPGIGIGQVILGLQGNQSGLYSIVIKDLPSEMPRTSFFGTGIPKDEVCPASSPKLSHSAPGYIYIPGIGLAEWVLTKES
jgi:hypothetical protein